MKPLNFIIFFLEKVFFQRVAVAVYTQPLSICKNLAKRKFQRNGKIIETKNKDNLPQKVYIKYFTKTDNFKVQDIREKFHLI